MTVGAAGGGAGAGVVEHGDERVGRVADHGLQVKAVLGEGRDGQGALPAGPRWKPRAGETSACRMRKEEDIRLRIEAKVKTPRKSVNEPLSAPLFSWREGIG